MFSSLKQKILLGVYIFLILSIPVGAYLASEQKVFKSSAKAPQSSLTKLKDLPQPSPKPKLIDLSDPQTYPDDEEPTASASLALGPTLSINLKLEGRTVDQSAKIFLGIAEGNLNPLTSGVKYVLIFNINLPKSGQYSGLSLAGLVSGGTYTAFLKGPSQIATSSAFVLKPTQTSLNEGNALIGLSGDLNEDNQVTSADYTIALSGNKNADFNKDGVVNSPDLTILQRNLGKIGAGGVWTSPPPPGQTGSPSEGYWLWVPGFDKL